MNIITHKSTIVLVLATAGLIAVVAVFAFSSNSEMTQPIAFNHKKHIENNVDCTVCHQFYTQSAKAGMPGVEVCEKCHEDVICVSQEKEKTLKYMDAREEIPWQQVYRVPHHVLFSHKRHIVAGKLECAQCHGDVARVTAPITKPAKDLDMDGCTNCHKTVYKNPNECIDCHR